MFDTYTYRRATWALGFLAIVAVLMLTMAPTSSGAGKPAHHLVKPGETLWSIASTHYHTSDPRQDIYQIEQANSLTDGSIVPGQVIVLP